MIPNNTRADTFGMGEYANGGKGIRKFIVSIGFFSQTTLDGIIYRLLH
jgi:hypothetical protein